MKNASTALKLTLIAACVITDQIVVDPYSEASAKKVVSIGTIFKQVQPDVSWLDLKNVSLRQSM